MADALSKVPVPVASEGPKKPLLGLSFLENLSEMSMLRQIAQEPLLLDAVIFCQCLRLSWLILFQGPVRFEYFL